MVRSDSTLRWLESQQAVLLIVIVFSFWQAETTLGQVPLPENTEPSSSLEAQLVAPLEIINRMDWNHDGLLELEEIPKGAELFVLRIAAEARIDVEHSIPLPELSASWLESVIRSQSTEHQYGESATDVQREQGVGDSASLWMNVGRSALAMAAVQAASGIDPILETIARLDADQDGILNPEEIPDGAEQFVKGVLDQEGFSSQRAVSLSHLAEKRRLRNADHAERRVKSAAAPPDHTTSRQHATYLIKLYDVDQDGMLNQSEWSALNPAWRDADSDRNGRLSAAEVSNRMLSLNSASRPRPPQPSAGGSQGPRWLLARDKNHDGHIHLDEFTGRWTDAELKEFLALDRNDDAVLDPAELRRAIADR